MKKIDLGQTTSILANLGVIAGIVFLAVQLRQNNDLLAAQARRDQLEARTATGLVELSQVDIAQINYKAASGQPLTAEERYYFRNFAANRFMHWEWQYWEYRAGTLSEQDLPVDGWALLLGESPELREVWKIYRENSGARSPEFIQFIETAVLRDSE